MNATKKHYEELKLTERQAELVKKLEDVMTELSNNGVEVVYDNDSGEFYAINISNIDESCWKLDYLIKEEEKENSVLFDPFEFRNYGQSTKLDYNIVIPRWDDELIVSKFKK